jgi:2-oxoglutarate/2-oxoacid ferredoxin oxidoreductase subunit alpha
MLLSDGYLANAAEPWLLPKVAEMEPIKTRPVPEQQNGDDGASVAFRRDPETLGRPWIAPGMPGLMHRTGGLEKDIRTGHISYDADNHQAMTRMRAEKVASVARFIPPQQIEIGPEKGVLAVVGWGSTYGALYQAVRVVTKSDPRVSHIHLRYLNPLPSNLGELLAGFERVLVPEMNMGQLATLLRDKLGLDPISLSKVTGQPFQVGELVEAIHEHLGPRASLRPAVQAVQGERA